jgi:hypothetical protein
MCLEARAIDALVSAPHTVVVVPGAPPRIYSIGNFATDQVVLRADLGGANGYPLPDLTSNFFVQLRAAVRIPQSATGYTFCVQSDDGFRLESSVPIFSNGRHSVPNAAVVTTSATLLQIDSLSSGFTICADIAAALVMGGAVDTTLTIEMFESAGGDFIKARIRSGLMSTSFPTGIILEDGALGWSVKLSASSGTPGFVGRAWALAAVTCTDSLTSLLRAEVIDARIGAPDSTLVFQPGELDTSAVVVQVGTFVDNVLATRPEFGRLPSNDRGLKVCDALPISTSPLEQFVLNLNAHVVIPSAGVWSLCIASGGRGGRFLSLVGGDSSGAVTLSNFRGQITPSLSSPTSFGFNALVFGQEAASCADVTTTAPNAGANLTVFMFETISQQHVGLLEACVAPGSNVNFTQTCLTLTDNVYGWRVAPSAVATSEAAGFIARSWELLSDELLASNVVQAIVFDQLVAVQRGEAIENVCREVALVQSTDDKLAFCLTQGVLSAGTCRVSPLSNIVDNAITRTQLTAHFNYARRAKHHHDRDDDDDDDAAAARCGPVAEIRIGDRVVWKSAQTSGFARAGSIDASFAIDLAAGTHDVKIDIRAHNCAHTEIRFSDLLLEASKISVVPVVELAGLLLDSSSASSASSS